MKILHILDHSIPLHSGYTFRTKNILRHQRELDLETFHITSEKHNIAAGNTLLEEDIDGLHFYRTPSSSAVIAKIPVLNQLAVVRSLENRLLEIADKIKPDILHAHSPVINGSAAVSVGRKLSIPVLYEVRAFWEDAAVDHGTGKEEGLRYKLTKMWETTIFKKAHAITTICEGLRNDIVQRGIAEDKVTVIPNAVNVEQFQVIKERDQELLDELQLNDKVILGFLGSFYAYEGLDLILKALPIIQQQHADAHVLLVGGGPEESALKNLAQALGITQSVTFTGRVAHEKVSRYYSLVDMLLYPRKSMRLTELVTPLKPLEAMAQGKLVLASDVGGHKELIKNSETGVLFEAGNHEKLAQSVIDLIGRRSAWSDYLLNGRNFVESERTWGKSIKNYIPVYEQLIAKGCQ